MIANNPIQQFAQQMEGLQQQLALLKHQLSELHSVKEGLESLGEASRNETLIPLGAGVYARGKVSESEKVLMNVGSSVVVEKPVSDALKTVEEQIKQLDDIAEQMEAEMGQVGQIMQMLQSQMQEISPESSK